MASPCTSIPMIVSVLLLSSELCANCPLLSAKLTRRVRPMRFIEIAGPQIIGLHHVEVAVHDQKPAF